MVVSSPVAQTLVRWHLEQRQDRGKRHNARRRPFGVSQAYSQACGCMNMGIQLLGDDVKVSVSERSEWRVSLVQLG